MTAAGNGLHDKSIQQWAVYVVEKLYFDEALSYVGLVVLNSHKFSSLCLRHALWGPHWCGSSQPPQLAIPLPTCAVPCLSAALLYSGFVNVGQGINDLNEDIFVLEPFTKLVLQVCGCTSDCE